AVGENDAIVKAFANVGRSIDSSLVETRARGEKSESASFANPLGTQLEDVLSELNVLRVGNSAKLAWHIYAEIGPDEWYESLVDAHSGELLLRHNLYVFDAQGTVNTGNNVEAYLDTNADNAPDNNNGSGLSVGHASSATQDFTFPFSTAVDPRTQQAAVVTNLFYYNNVMHDFSYTLGFTETSGNFQTNNYGRGGIGNDSV